jgi:radical SAM superfamily enzyme YgiQ (UPF0313 family)
MTDPRALLLDLPTRPGGFPTLSLPTVGACLRERFRVRIRDLNAVSVDDALAEARRGPPPAMVGLKVGAQNFEIAKAVTRALRGRTDSPPVVWGGELPTLEPELCGRFSDSVVSGRFEGVAGEFADDLLSGRLRARYRSNGAPVVPPVPAFDLVADSDALSRCFGVPLETSLGCPEGCAFCLVHAAQPKPRPLPLSKIEEDLARGGREFVGVIDYNFGQDKEHLLAVAGAIGRSSAKGFSAELCLEALDDEQTLSALAKNRCRFVYCGLESLSESSLKSVAKMQNRVEDYRRIIGRAQAYGIEVASGFILGLQGTRAGDFDAFVDFCEESGILYLKLTFLTFNPGTKARTAMESKGRFLSDSISDFDGNKLTFLPEGLDEATVLDGARRMIERFYSPYSVWRRSRHLSGKPSERAEFALTSSLFGSYYRDWLDPASRPLHRPSWRRRGAERLLRTLRGYRAARA